MTGIGKHRPRSASRLTSFTKLLYSLYKDRHIPVIHFIPSTFARILSAIYDIRDRRLTENKAVICSWNDDDDDDDDDEEMD